MMRHLLFILTLFCSINLAGQFGTAHDFTVTDLNGNEHNLFNILDSGKLVVLDVSATWCGPCWDVHQGHYLEDLYAEFGPEGSNTIEIIFYEGDIDTGIDALNGIGAGTLGDWVTGVSYPIINEAPLQLDLDLYAPLGFPTISLIRPSDREITEDMWDWDLDQMSTAVENMIFSEGLSSTKEEILLAKEVEIFPNPATDLLQFETTLNIIKSQVLSITGQLIKEPVNTKNAINISDLEQGQYILRITTGDQKVINKKFSKI